MRLIEYCRFDRDDSLTKFSKSLGFITTCGGGIGVLLSAIFFDDFTRMEAAVYVACVIVYLAVLIVMYLFLKPVYPAKAEDNLAHRRCLTNSLKKLK